MKNVGKMSVGLILAITVWVASSPGSSGGTLNDYARATDFEASSVAIHCVDGACIIPLIVPWTFQLGSVGTPYEAVVTASFTYRTSKGVTVEATPRLLDGGTELPLTDADRPLGPAARSRSTDLTWVIPGLDANTVYGLDLYVHPTGTPPSTYDIVTSNITFVVEAAPA